MLAQVDELSYILDDRHSVSFGSQSHFPARMPDRNSLHIVWQCPFDRRSRRFRTAS
jgi:hypothetical protein